MKYKYILMAMAMIVVMCSSVFAQTTFECRGSAVVPGIKTFSSSSSVHSVTTLFVSNITGSDVACKVTVYDHNGNDVSYLCDILTGNDASSSVVTLASGTGEFFLPRPVGTFVSGLPI